jgi:hypothetical protein
VFPRFLYPQAGMRCLCASLLAGFIEHGYAKLTHGPEGFIAILHAIGMPFAHLFGWATIAVEIIGGGLILLGAVRTCSHAADDHRTSCGNLYRSSSQRIQLDQIAVLRLDGGAFRPARI